MNLEAVGAFSHSSFGGEGWGEEAFRVHRAKGSSRNALTLIELLLVIVMLFPNVHVQGSGLACHQN